MKTKHLFYLIAFIVIASSGCKKSVDTVQTHEQSLVEVAKEYFNKEVLVTLPHAPSGSNTSIEESTRNPRKTLSKSPEWEKAYTTKLSIGEAVVIPVHFKKPFLIRSNFSGNKFYSIDDLTKLLIYQDANKKYHAEVITLYPDSSYENHSATSFRGIASVEDWQGNMITKYKYSPDGKIRVYNPASLQQRNMTSDRTKNESASLSIIQVCYESYGYNYAIDDPENGYYWSEFLGCDTYFVDEARSTFVTGDDYGGMSGGGGGGGESGISVADAITVIPGDAAIANIKDYNKCFDNIPGSDHSYQVSVCVSQPNPGSRDAWTFNNMSGSGNTGNPFFVGHTFLTLSETAPSKSIVRNVGFYPASRVNPYTPSTSGALNNDESHDFNISLTINLNSSEFTSLLNFIEQANSTGMTYNLNSNNCTTFALNALSNIGVNLPHTTGSWLNGAGNNPGDLGEDIRQMSLGSNMTRNTGGKPHPNKGTCY